MGKLIIKLLKYSGVTNSAVTILSFIMMGIGFISNLFWGYEVDEFIYESMQWIVMIGLGATASEKVSKQIKINKKHK